MCFGWLEVLEILGANLWFNPLRTGAEIMIFRKNYFSFFKITYLDMSLCKKSASKLFSTLS